VDGLRQPLEEGVIRVSRALASVEFPARVLLVAAMNPCPCGEGGLPGRCECLPSSRERYLRRVSGPLLDRFDLRLAVRRPTVTELLDAKPAESTAQVANLVASARRRAAARGVERNGDIPGHLLDELAPLTAAAAAVLRGELERGRLSGRGLHRVRRVALTITDLAASPPPVDVDAVHEALGLRLDPLRTARRVA